MYLGLLSPRVIFIPLQMQTVSPSLEFGLTQLWFKERKYETLAFAQS